MALAPHTAESATKRALLIAVGDYPKESGFTDLAYGCRGAGANQLTAETWLKLAVDHPDWRTGPKGKKTHDPMTSACTASVNVDFKLSMVACTSPSCTGHSYCLKSSN